jgi:hypothetical protein
MFEFLLTPIDINMQYAYFCEPPSLSSPPSSSVQEIRGKGEAKVYDKKEEKKERRNQKFS